MDRAVRPEGKPWLDLLPPRAAEETVLAFQDGARKYHPWAWRHGRPYSHHEAAILRHWLAWKKGQDIDPDSGVHHMAHIASRAMILLEFWADKRFRKFDDRSAAREGPSREP